MIDAALAEVAARWGVQTGYWDINGDWHDVVTESLLAVLNSLGAAIESPDDAAAAVAAHDRTLVAAPIEPVIAVAPGATVSFELRLPVSTTGSVLLLVTTETGDEVRTEVDLDRLAPHTRREVDGRSWDIRWVVTEMRLPVGYHRAVVEAGGASAEAVVLVPPSGLPAIGGPPTWGVFAPTYAFVPTGRPGLDHFGVGHLGHLGELGARLGPLGARVVSTLPLLATFLDEPFEPSPYSPISRRWWSELHLDPTRLPGLSESPAARELMASRRIAAAAADLAAQPLIDQRGAARLVREVVDAIVADIGASSGPTATAVDRFAAEQPELEQYARFRALVEGFGGGWGDARPEWSGRPIGDRDVDASAVARHRYIQFAADAQMADLADEFRSRSQFLALDLPLGANPGGFDVWANPADYVEGSATGAPPDPFFSGGQDWGFPPLNPITSRARGHEELKLAVRHHMRHSGLLRIDHLMSLERLWWIPEGHAATEGVYVRYPTNELMAMIAIEAERADAVVVGENLGTVSDDINATMEQWGMLGMYELQFEVWRAREHGHLRIPAPLTFAGLNTHDMPTLAGWWAGHDIVDAVDLGLVDPAEAPGRIADRHHQIEAFVEVLRRDLGADIPVEPGPVLQAALEWLGRTPAQVVLATLEDLWLEERPQNVPGTNTERPNWRRRFANTLDEVFDAPDVRAALAALQRARPAIATEEIS